MASAHELERDLIQRVNVGDSPTRSAARYPERIALVEGERRHVLRDQYARYCDGRL